MRNQLRNVIATDIPQPAPAPERAPLEIDADLRRRDAWMFVPLIAAAVTLPLIAAALLGLSAWHLATHDGVAAKANKPPTTFASRWPEHEMPTVMR
jgi:hypothetical protein